MSNSIAKSAIVAAVEANAVQAADPNMVKQVLSIIDKAGDMHGAHGVWRIKDPKKMASVPLRSSGPKPLPEDVKVMKLFIEAKGQGFIVLEAHEATNCVITTKDNVEFVDAAPDDARAFMYGTSIVKFDKPGVYVFAMNH